METAKKKTLSYEDIQPIVEYLIRAKASSYSFDVYGSDDIAQEIRIICMNALPKLDVERVKEGKLQNFFGRCVDNGLKNLKRDKYIRVSAYSKAYKELDVDDRSEKAQDIRRRYENDQRKIKNRLAIRHTAQIDELSELLKNEQHEEEMEYKDLEKHLIELAPDDIIVPLKLMLSGRIKQVTRNEKKRVQKFVKKILDEL